MSLITELYFLESKLFVKKSRPCSCQSGAHTWGGSRSLSEPSGARLDTLSLVSSPAPAGSPFHPRGQQEGLAVRGRPLAAAARGLTQHGAAGRDPSRAGGHQAIGLRSLCMRDTHSHLSCGPAQFNYQLGSYPAKHKKSPHSSCLGISLPC